MVDTRRTLTDLLTIQFPDGLTEGSIVAQTMRDLIVSLMPSYGAMSTTTSAPTIIATPGVYVKALGGTGIPAGFSARDFSVPVANRLRYDGTVAIHAFASGSVSVSSAGANKQVGLKAALNGVVIDESIITRNLGSIGDVAALSFHVGMTMNPTDYLEMWVTNIDDTASVTIEEMYFHVHGGVV